MYKATSLIFAAALLGLALGQLEEYVVVNTTLGQVRGEVEDFVGWFPTVGVENIMTATEWAGIPYAQPPVGDLRWQPPVVMDPWTGVRDALDFNVICYQRDIDSYYGVPVEISEDCLYLSVWTPGDAVDPSNLNLSVMFYIHGGAFQLGTGMNPLQFGGYLAADQNVVVVGFNYRLGVMGFFSTEDDTAPGNYGLMDIIEALRWTKANIRNFGGNPDSITIFGQSAGGAAVTYLMTSPAANGLFNRAISQSGVATMYWAQSRDYLRELSATLATEMNCPPDNSPAMVTCLKGRDPWEVTNTSLKINLDMQSTRDDTQSVFAPRVDGNIVPDDPLTLVTNGQFQPVDFMTGITNHESWPYRHMWYIMIPGIRRWVERGINSDDFDHLTAHWMRFLNYPARRTEVLAAIKQQYDINFDEDVDSLVRSAGYIDFLSDFQFIAHNDRYARLYSRNAGSSNVYNYYFSPFVSRDQRVIWEATVPNWIYATHADDVGFVFGKAKYTMEDLVTTEERLLSDEMMRTWSNFAKTGSPGSLNDVAWPAFTEANPSYLEITTPLANVRVIDSFYPERMSFWRDHVWPVLDQPSADDGSVKIITTVA
ncbi:unnamed protein product [Owenia fusiformis]|uniref:Carboxylic ester hydrolase n=1 Tax=Owenia fusiformis TaxID=6347 RepID=A0A8J1Y0T5_OWEFU|nr:unnamed protein product [Owenia fusiformis]